MKQRDTGHEQRPILVTGAHRSGTTWLGTMLSLADETFLVPLEPFNPGRRNYGLGGHAKQWFAYGPDLPQEEALRAFRRVLDGRAVGVLRRRYLLRDAARYLAPWAHPRLVIKDPIAAMSSEWLAQHFDLDVVVLVRHPAAFTASLLRMGWTFDFDNFLDQPALMREHLAEFEDDFRRSHDVVETAALVWTALYSVLTNYADRNPDWIVATHEDLSNQALPRLRLLYEQLSLPWNSAVAEGVRRYTSGQNPVDAPDGVLHQLHRDSAANTQSWLRRLSPADAHRIRTITEPVACRFYDDADWGAGGDDATSPLETHP